MDGSQITNIRSLFLDGHLEEEEQKYKNKLQRVSELDQDTGGSSHLDVSRSFQVTGDVHVQGAVVLWELLLQINVCVLDHLKRAVVRKE